MRSEHVISDQTDRTCFKLEVSVRCLDDQCCVPPTVIVDPHVRLAISFCTMRT